MAASGGGAAVAPPVAAVGRGLAIDATAVLADLLRLVRIPSITGSEEAVQEEVERRFREIGLDTSRIEVDPEAFALDPDFPGSEMPRQHLPIVVGRLGRPGGRR